MNRRNIERTGGPHVHECILKLLSSLRKARAKGFQFASLRIIFDVKVDLRRKARLVIRVHVVNSSGREVDASTMKYVSSRILITNAAANNLDVVTGDIGNAYLNANTEEIYILVQVPSFK